MPDIQGYRGGVSRPSVTTGAIDPVRARVAKKAISAGGYGMYRNAGMMLDTVQTTHPYSSGYRLDAYRSSYANGLDQRSGTYDVPTYFVQMNDQNGGILYWPVTLQEKYQWYRYWARCFTNPNVLVTRANGTESPLYSFRPGDKVINALGKTVEVDEVTSQRYVGEVVKLDVEANRWNDLEVTPEHPFYVVRASKIIRHHHRVKDEQGIEHRQTKVEIDFSPEWVEAKDIQKGDCLVVPKVHCEKPEVLCVEMARLIGYYLAEGNVNFDRNGSPEAVTWSLGSHEQELIDEIKSLCVSLYGSEPSEYNYSSRETLTSLRLWNREFASWIYEHCGTGSRSKCLSESLFNADDESVKNIIGCWLNGDGYRDKAEAEGQFDGTTCSEDMAHQLYLMMVRIGLAPAKRKHTVFKYGSDEVSGPGWRIYLPPMYANEIAEYTKWGKSDKAFRHRKYNHGGNMLLPVREVSTRHYDGLIWNISTRGETHDERTFLVYGMATHNTDAYIGRALELLSDLPMSKLTLNLPKDVPEEKREEILNFYEYQMEIIGAFELCQDILWERNMIGNVSIFHEWDSKRKLWSRAVMLPPEEVYIFELPFANGNKQVQYRPERLISMILAGESLTSDDGYGCDNANGGLQSEILSNIPEELVRMVKDNGCIIMDTDPTTGSFVHHIARRKSRYHDLGASVLERVLNPMLLKEHFKYTQLSLASRNMTPKNMVTANGLLPAELDDLRTQIDLSYLDPDYTIVTNYDVSWEQIGAQDRLLDLSTEYERIESQIFAALGVTRELLTGEGSFSGNKITVEILNTMFLLERTVLTNYLEKQLFQPIAEAHGWFKEFENGIKKYWHPKVGFNRLTIRDNAEVFDSLFQLYQKGSLDIDVIYELFNINSDDVARRLKAQLFTVKDATFNRSVEEINSEVGRAIVEKTDIVDRVAKYLGLEIKETEEGEDEGGGFGDFGDFGSDYGGAEEEGSEEQEEAPFTEEPVGDQPEEPDEQLVETGGDEQVNSDKVQAVVDAVTSELPPDASDEEIEAIVKQVAEEIE